jgi:hypothetical protein
MSENNEIGILGNENNQEFRSAKKIEQKNKLYESFYKMFGSYVIDYIQYFFNESSEDYIVDDTDNTVDHYRNDNHILYAIVWIECDKKVIRMSSQSSYDFTTAYNYYQSHESHTSSPHICTFSFKKFFNCDKKHTCYNCNSFNITSIFYCDRLCKTKEKVYIRDDWCHNCSKEIQYRGQTRVSERLFEKQTDFIDLYDEECKHRYYIDYFSNCIIPELLSAAMHPSRMEWFLDSDQKCLWNC